MCGILGSINISNTKPLLNTIKHRGPDGSGVCSYQVNTHEVALLHRRLSIVDLSEAGRQPMETFDRKGCIIFNGEIYNHEDIRKQLPAVSFNGHSDTETIVNYFRVYNIETHLIQLNGIFGLAYLDLAAQKLYLTRDRYGVKPLYYYFSNNQLLFSSEIRPLQAHLHRSPDKGALLNSLRMRYTPAPLTIYKDIYKVEPGQIVVFDMSSSQIHIEKKYFVTDKQKIGTRKGEWKQLTNEYGDLFEKAVERQMMADVEVGVLLSGGVDSALVAAVAKQKSKTKLKAFTVGFDGNYKDIDEIAYASQTAQILGLEHFQERIRFEDFLGLFKKIVEIVEEPLATTSIIPMYSLSKLAASKVKVVLSGQGADEPLGGYNKYRSLNFLQQVRSSGIFKSIARSLKSFKVENEKLERFLSAAQARDTIDSYLAYNAIFSLHGIEKLVPENEKGGLLQSCANRDKVFKDIWSQRVSQNLPIKDVFLYYDLRSSLADDLLMYTDKITMHFSLECRVPILDNELIEFIESLESTYKYNSRQGKLIHKAFAAEYLPSEIINRKKLGFQSPTAEWFRKNNSQILDILLSGNRFCELFDSQAVSELLIAHLNGNNLEKQIFSLLSIYYLMLYEYD